MVSRELAGVPHLSVLASPEAQSRTVRDRGGVMSHHAWRLRRAGKLLLLYWALSWTAGSATAVGYAFGGSPPAIAATSETCLRSTTSTSAIENLSVRKAYHLFDRYFEPIPPTPAPLGRFGLTASVVVDYLPGDQVYLTGSPTSLAPVCVDDALRIDVWRADGSHRELTWSFYTSDHRAIQTHGPIDLTPYVTPGDMVQADRENIFPATLSSSDIYLLVIAPSTSVSPAPSFSPAPPTVSVASVKPTEAHRERPGTEEPATVTPVAGRIGKSAIVTTARAPSRVNARTPAVRITPGASSRSSSTDARTETTSREATAETSSPLSGAAPSTPDLPLEAGAVTTLAVATAMGTILIRRTSHARDRHPAIGIVVERTGDLPKELNIKLYDPDVELLDGPALLIKSLAIRVDASPDGGATLTPQNDWHGWIKNGQSLSGKEVVTLRSGEWVSCPARQLKLRAP